MLRMTVEGVGFDHLKQTVVVLKDWESKKLLPIWIGAAEARSIALQLEGTTPERPLSHDLLMNCVQALGGRVVRVVINDLQETTFYATIDIDTAGGMLHIDSRPSDAIAVAVRAQCPVFVDGGALDALVDMTGEREESGSSAETISEEQLEAEWKAAEATRQELMNLPSEAQPENGGSNGGQSDAKDDDEITRFKRLVGDLDL
jgi:bifunctional DNase/RNase